MKDDREHIVILGGGVGGCVAAYWLSATEELRKKYRVTLYQTGWRLGGKGASSRNPDKQFRSEEHGPHVWFGFYENAFTTLRGCAEELDLKNHPIGDVDRMFDDEPGSSPDFHGLFQPSSEGVFFNRISEKNWYPWKVSMRRYSGQPGDGYPQPDVRDSLWRAADLLAGNTELKRLFGPWTEKVAAWIGGILGRHFPVSRPADCCHEVIPIEPGDYASYLSRRLVDLAGSERHWYGEWLTGRTMQLVLDVIGRKIRRRARKPGLSQDELRELSLLDLCRTCLRGALVDVLLRDKTFSQLDGIEFQDWLKLHGAAYHDLESSPFLRGYYDTPFAFSKGMAHSAEHANFAAGAALRGFFRIFFGHKGSYLYHMNLGMGECVFIPLYRVLKKRGVKIEFFHRVDALESNEAGNRVESIRITRQARVATESGEYQPLAEVTLDGKVWPYWPDRPDTRQLDPASLPASDDPGFESAWSTHPGEPLVLADRRADGTGADGRFDHVILAIPPGAHERIAASLMKKDTRFRTMVESSETIRTLACQIWISAGDGSHNSLGWDKTGTCREHLLGAATPDPLNVILDATRILRTEATVGANHVFYFCGPAENDKAEPPFGSDPGYPARAHEAAKKKCIEYLDENLFLWPGLCKSDGLTFDPDRLHHPGSKAGPQAKRDWQYFRINLDPSERYVLSTDESTPTRLAPWDTGFSNLLHAGDWCRNRIDIGCVESAATSAMLAARHLTGYPTKDMIAGMQYE
jgi:uncharacterized protein with NAD-binding domain and iron-sulfur cluster